MSSTRFLKNWAVWNSAPTPEAKQRILKQAIDRLDGADLLVKQRQEYMQRKCDNMLLLAKERIAHKDRVGAKGYLRQRRQCEAEYMKLTLMSDVIATHKLALEGAVMSDVVFNALKTSVEAMRTINNGQAASTQDAETLMEKLQDHSQNASEVSDALSQPLVKIDEDELERELDALMDIESGGEPVPRHPPSSPTVCAVSSSSSISSAVQSASSSAPPVSVVANIAALSAPATTATASRPSAASTTAKKAAMQLAQ